MKEDRLNRKKRIRAVVSGTREKPRLSVFRSDRFIYAQIIDDVKRVTLANVSDWDIKTGTKVEKAFKAGEKLAELAKKKKIKKVIFDRGGYKYHGRIKFLADGARKGGLEF